MFKVEYAGNRTGALLKVVSIFR